jgi:anti-sigma factor RsiW
MASSSQCLVAVATKSSPHIDPETIEKYSMQRLSAKAVASVEEHLLICQVCQEALQASDAYIAAMRTAAADLRQAERKPKRKRVRKGAGT